jgi:NAD(P)-dependent dehydrogenase (short-subunit alcohol dehydrogenase family)
MTASTATKTLFDLTGKTALVTGASSGLGRAMATALATSGCHVILAARRVERLQDATKDIRTLTGKEDCVSVVPADLSSLDGVQQLANTVSQFSPDILINAAGVNLRQPSDEITAESWEQTLFLNLTVPCFLSRHLVQNSMRPKGWGKIVNIASLQSVRAFPNSMPYGASKGGVAQLTRAMAEDWSQHGIGCNAIAPGFFPTELTATLFEDEKKSQALAKQTAIGRNGLLEDIHGPTIFLCSPASDYVTGQVLFVDGGFSAK